MPRSSADERIIRLRILTGRLDNDNNTYFTSHFQFYQFNFVHINRIMDIRVWNGGRSTKRGIEPIISMHFRKTFTMRLKELFLWVSRYRIQLIIKKEDVKPKIRND
jgi:hypothetical protein